MRILVIEDYEPVRSSVSETLKEEGFSVESADNGSDGLWLARHFSFDAIILDIMLPKIGGMEILQTLRSEKVTTPILLLTARNEVNDRVAGLDSGGDDYLVKPFAMAELLARIRVLIRRNFGENDSLIEMGPLVVNTVARHVTVSGTTLDLTAGEYRLLELLCRRKNQVVTRTEIWDSLYDINSETTSNVVDVYIGYLRKKLKAAGLPPLIETRRGMGYRLNERVED